MHRDVSVLAYVFCVLSFLKGFVSQNIHLTHMVKCCLCVHISIIVTMQSAVSPAVMLHGCEASLLLELPPLKSHIPRRWPLGSYSVLLSGLMHRWRLLCPLLVSLHPVWPGGGCRRRSDRFCTGPRPARHPTLLRVSASSHSGAEMRVLRAKRNRG